MDVDPRRHFRERAHGVGPAPVGDIIVRGTRLRRQRIGAVAGAVAVILVAAGVVGLQTRQRAPMVKLHVVGTPSSAVTPSPAASPSVTSSTAAPRTPAGAAVSGVSGLAIEDTTWASVQEGWVLGMASCQGTPCTVILHTTDGGSTWTRVAAPEGVTHLRFATAGVGYAYSATALYETGDGATSWIPQPVPGITEGLELTGGSAYRVTASQDGCPAACNPTVESATIGGTTWRPLPAPAITQGFGDAIVAQGTDLYFIAFGHPAGGGIGQSRIARSRDSGATWRTMTDPCSPQGSSESDARALSAAPGGFLAVLCVPRASGSAASFVMASSDAGATFGPHHPVGTATDSALTLAAGSPTNLAVAVWTGTDAVVDVTHDGGLTWHSTVGTALANAAASNPLLRFEDATTARASFGDGTLYTTTDAGDTWSAARPAG